jgi:hypothetical protein
MQNNWLSTSELSAEIGCSVKFLLRNRETFLRGTWITINPTAFRPTYRWDKVAVFRALNGSKTVPGQVKRSLKNS